MEEESNGELAFLDTLMERSLDWYIGSLHILTITYTTALTTKQVARKVLFSPCLIEHISLSQINMNLHNSIAQGQLKLNQQLA